VIYEVSSRQSKGFEVESIAFYQKEETVTSFPKLKKSLYKKY